MVIVSCDETHLAESLWVSWMLSEMLNSFVHMNNSVQELI